MKNFYEQPSLSILLFPLDDILTTSGEDSRFNLNWMKSNREEEVFAE